MVRAMTERLVPWQERRRLSLDILVEDRVILEVQAARAPDAAHEASTAPDSASSAVAYNKTRPRTRPRHPGDTPGLASSAAARDGALPRKRPPVAVFAERGLCVRSITIREIRPIRGSLSRMNPR